MLHVNALYGAALCSERGLDITLSMMECALVVTALVGSLQLTDHQQLGVEEVGTERIPVNANQHGRGVDDVAHSDGSPGAVSIKLWVVAKFCECGF